MRSLANHCLDLAFVRPTPREVTLTLRRVAKAEGYSVDDATLEKLAESCNSDIRQVLTRTRTRTRTRTQTLTLTLTLTPTSARC